jgi:D,D-heptose 1,7-bisphosphate phosphatase
MTANPTVVDIETFQAIVLVGGLGSRLGEMTAQTPKPLLHVAGKPFLEHLLFELGRHRIRKIVLAAQFGSQKIVDFVANSDAVKQFGLDVKVSIEPERAGTGGALFHARDILEDKFFVLNGDSWLDMNLLTLSSLIVPQHALGVLALRQVDDALRYGVVEIEGIQIKAFRERPEKAGPGLVNGGIYFCKKEILDFAKSKCSFEQDILPAIAKAGCLYGHITESYFIDIGVPESLALAQTDLKKWSKRRAVFLDRDGVLNIDSGHVGQVADFKWIAGARAAVKTLNDKGYLVFVVTNQAGVAKGFYSEADIQTLHAHMDRELSLVGAHIDDYRYCPFHPDGRVDAFRKISNWRKPEAGMILDLAKTWPVDMDNSLLIGDKITDVQAAENALLKAFLFEGDDLSEFLNLVFV